MGYRVDFIDNQEISADVLNSAATAFSPGALSFRNNTEYGVTDLNNIAKSLITKGVADGGCIVTLSGDTINISTGIAYFEDGKKIVVDSEGTQLERISGADCYVWFKHDTQTGYATPMCTTEEPSGDCVSLAQITAGGVVYDTRDIAFMKNSSLLPNKYKSVTLTITVSSTPDYTGSINIGENYKRMILRGNEGKGFAYYDWDANLVYYTSGGNLYTANIGSQSVYLTLNNTLSVSLVSFENGILSFNTNTYDERRGSCTIECM